jgi:hypothetical protein
MMATRLWPTSMSATTSLRIMASRARYVGQLPSAELICQKARRNTVNKTTGDNTSGSICPVIHGKLEKMHKPAMISRVSGLLMRPSETERVVPIAFGLIVLCMGLSPFFGPNQIRIGQ